MICRLLPNLTLVLRYIESNNNWREEVPKILIFITDGRPQDKAKVPAAAKSLRDKGVRVFAIGVGDATREELEEIASQPYDQHIIFIQGGRYYIKNIFVEQMIKKGCFFLFFRN